MCVLSDKKLSLQQSCIKHTVQNIDHSLFWAVHDGLSTPFLDVAAPFLRSKLNWIPVYLGLSGWIFYKMGFRKGLAAILFVAGTAALANTLAAEVLKPLIGRARPCQLWPQVAVLVECGGGKSFPSAHAANHFALSLAIWKIWPAGKSWPLAFMLAIWAFSVAFAQVYVGVHFPSDCLAGACLGLGVAWAVHFALVRLVRPFPNGGDSIFFSRKNS